MKIKWTSLLLLTGCFVLGVNTLAMSAKKSSAQPISINWDLAWQNIAQKMRDNSNSALLAFEASQIRIKQNDFKSAKVYLQRAKKLLPEDTTLDVQAKKDLKLQIDQAWKVIKKT